MNIKHCLRSEVGHYILSLNTYNEELVYEFLQEWLLKDTGINIVRLRYGPTGIDGISSEVPDISIHKHFKHWNCDWIYVTDHKWTLKGKIPDEVLDQPNNPNLIKNKSIIKDEKV